MKLLKNTNLPWMYFSFMRMSTKDRFTGKEPKQLIFDNENNLLLWQNMEEHESSEDSPDQDHTARNDAFNSKEPTLANIQKHIQRTV